LKHDKTIIPDISQLIWHFRVCIFYQNFLRGGLLFTIKTNQGFQIVKLKSWLRTFCCRHHDLINRYEISVSFVVDTTPSFSQYDSCHFKIINVDIALDCVSGITFFSFSELFWNAFSLYSDSMTRSYISWLGELISIRCC
jgi:hypothetical protein